MVLIPSYKNIFDLPPSMVLIEIILADGTLLLLILTFFCYMRPNDLYMSQSPFVSLKVHFRWF